MELGYPREILCSERRASMTTFVSPHVLTRDKSAATCPLPSEPQCAGMKRPRWGPPLPTANPRGALALAQNGGRGAAPLRSAPPASRETCGGAGAARCKWRGGGLAARVSWGAGGAIMEHITTPKVSGRRAAIRGSHPFFSRLGSAPLRIECWILGLGVGERTGWWPPPLPCAEGRAGGAAGRALRCRCPWGADVSEVSEAPSFVLGTGRRYNERL